LVCNHDSYMVSLCGGHFDCVRFSVTVWYIVVGRFLGASRLYG